MVFPRERLRFLLLRAGVGQWQIQVILVLSEREGRHSFWDSIRAAKMLFKLANTVVNSQWAILQCQVWRACLSGTRMALLL